MTHIETKQDFYKLSRKLLLGNILQQWDWEQFLIQVRRRAHGTTHELPSNGIVGVRHVRQSFTNKGISQLMKIEDAYTLGIQTHDKENLLFDVAAPHDRLTIQGEVMSDYRGLYVRYSHLQVHQRILWIIDKCGIADLKLFQLPHNLQTLTKAQKRGESPVVHHVEGLRAVSLLKQYMDVMSWEKLNDLLSCQIDDHPDIEFNFEYPIIEFACFDCRVGQLKWNSLFWEVRTNY